MKAFVVGALDVRSIVFAENVAKAKYAVFESANDAGYDIKFSDIQYARRIKELDGMLVGSLRPMRCYSEETVRRGEV